MARIVTAAARDFGDVLDGDDSDDHLDGPASISNLSTPVKPPLSTSTASTPNSMTASTPNKSSLSASSSSGGSTASGSAAKASAGGGAAYKQQQQQSFGSPSRGDDVVEGIANALSSDEEEFSMAASPRSPNGPPLYTPNMLKSSPPAKPTTKPELLVFTVDSPVFTVDSPPPPASHSDSNESSEPTTTRAAAAAAAAGGRSILGGLFGFGKSSSSSSGSGSSNPNPKTSAAHEGVVVGAGVGVGSSGGGGAHAGAGALGLRELRIEVSEGPVGIVWGDVPPPFSDPSLGGAVGVFVFSLKPGGRAERAGV
eukprot:jgi/Chrpa1/19625/Chrysochromulina_OHIO_Genome00022972-RA